MQNFLLMIIVLAAFIFGWFIMKKVDSFIEECRRGANDPVPNRWEVQK